ncbi:SpoIIE family protein phosphatase [Streptomyces sp. NPDC047453]|uniref:PP2C family protein-serine/threonine phosphatase n=1 Tax=Streptomyces sp. NPDC047453 TaxID=3154812 RepID=UPI0033F8F14C
MRRPSSSTADGSSPSLPHPPRRPSGWGDLGRDHPHVDEVDFPSGATFLLYTDGVIEARNRSGDFYPLAERLPGWTRLKPQALVEAIHSDLRRHVGRGLGDDVTMVAVQRDRPTQCCGRKGLPESSRPPVLRVPPTPFRLWGSIARRSITRVLDVLG